MSNEISNTNNKYDLKERTTVLAENVLDIIKLIKINDTNRNIISQLSRSGTSIGANYMEADGAESRRDFEHKISICRKEAKETMYWSRLLARQNPEQTRECLKIQRESQELVYIFSAIITKSKKTDLERI